MKEIPDLAIEVVFSSSGIEDLKKYQILSIKEVWFWLKNQLNIYVLVNGNYQKQQYSFPLPKIEDKLLTKYISQALTGNPRVLKKSFCAEIN